MIDKTFPLAERFVSNALILVQQLEQLLNQEAAHLTKGTQEIELLNSIIEKKQPLIVQINQFSRQMSQVLATETLPNDQNGLLQYFAKAKATGLNITKIHHDWNEITRTSAICQKLNEQNGASIDILRKHTQRSIQILKGTSQNTVTYGKDGTTKSSLNSRALFSV
jgi:flagellar biosynthesis protein FlgN